MVRGRSDRGSAVGARVAGELQGRRLLPEYTQSEEEDRAKFVHFQFRDVDPYNFHMDRGEYFPK